MSWQPIARGAYVNWAQPDPLSGTDPYLVWADGCGFAPYGGLPASGKLATLIELKPGKTVSDLIANSGGGVALADIPGPYRVADGPHPKFITAWPTAEFFKRLKTSLAPIVARAEISLPVVPQRPRYKPPVAPVCGPAVSRSIGRKTLLGVIDDGCAFAHYHLQNSLGNTRVCAMWDQQDQGAFVAQGQVPCDFGRGREVTGMQLQTLINSFTQFNAVDEDACYATATYDRLQKAATHGAHVTDVLAGSLPVGARVTGPGGGMVPPTWADANDTAASYIRAKIAQTVNDPETARLLSPTQVFGCKRLCVDTGYFETFNRPNVKLVDIRSGPIEQITPTGLIAGGTAFDLDVLVFATGFDAMTGSLHKIDIKGRGGEALVDKWAAGPRTYLGLGTAGFPNLFIISGPGSPSVLSNMVPSIEQHVNWIADCLGNMARTGKSQIEPTHEAEDAWVDQVNAIADATLYPTCNSWYLGANVPGKPRVFMPYIGVPTYNEHCEAVVAAGYEGFELR